MNSHTFSESINTFNSIFTIIVFIVIISTLLIINYRNKKKRKEYKKFIDNIKAEDVVKILLHGNSESIWFKFTVKNIVEDNYLIAEFNIDDTVKNVYDEAGFVFPTYVHKSLVHKP